MANSDAHIPGSGSIDALWRRSWDAGRWVGGGVRESLRYAIGLIGAGMVLAAVMLAITPISLNGNSCQGSVVYVGRDSIMNSRGPAPSQFEVFVADCMSARQSREHLALGLAAAGVVLILGSAFVRPRPKVPEAGLSTAEQGRP